MKDIQITYSGTDETNHSFWDLTLRWPLWISERKEVAVLVCNGVATTEECTGKNVAKNGVSEWLGSYKLSLETV